MAHARHGRPARHRCFWHARGAGGGAGGLRQRVAPCARRVTAVKIPTENLSPLIRAPLSWRRPVRLRASSRGVSMMEPDAAPAGARVRSSRTREALGRRPSPLGGTALNGWTRRGRRAAKAARIGLAASRPGPRPEVTAPGTEKPRWRAERRHALRETVRDNMQWPRRSARHPLLLRRGKEGDYGLPGAAKNTGAGACLMGRPAFCWQRICMFQPATGTPPWQTRNSTISS